MNFTNNFAHQFLNLLFFLTEDNYKLIINNVLRLISDAEGTRELHSSSPRRAPIESRLWLR